MITVALSATIGAPIERVWRALTDSGERIAWDERILGEVTLPRTSKRKQKSSPESTKWRFRLSGIPVVLRDQTTEVEIHERLVSRISVGSMQFDQTLTLYQEDVETGSHTRLGMKIVARNKITVVGEVDERHDVQRIVIEFVDTTLRQVQKYCEAGV